MKFAVYSSASFAILGGFRHRRSRNPSGVHSNNCLRHGNSGDVRAVRAVCLLMGGAAASSALGYLSSCQGTSGTTARAPEMTHSDAFSELGAGASYHACSEAGDSPHFNSFDFQGDSDFDAFDCGGFSFWKKSPLGQVYVCSRWFV